MHLKEKHIDLHTYVLRRVTFSFFEMKLAFGSCMPHFIYVGLSQSVRFVPYSLQNRQGRISHSPPTLCFGRLSLCDCDIEPSCAFNFHDLMVADEVRNLSRN